MWQEHSNKLHASFEFRNFRTAFAFMTEVAMIAEQLNHHPEWSNVWNKVSFQLCTHSAGNVVTDKDRQLAKLIEEAYSKYR